MFLFNIVDDPERKECKMNENKNNEMSIAFKALMISFCIISVLILVAAYLSPVIIYLIQPKAIAYLIVIPLFIWFFSLILMVVVRVMDSKNIAGIVVMILHIITLFVLLLMILAFMVHILFTLFG